MNAVVGIPEDSSYRAFAVQASDSSWYPDAGNTIGLAYQTDPVSCQWSQSADQAKVKPTPPGIHPRWTADWHYAHVTSTNWRSTKRGVLAKRWCRSTARVPVAEDTLWCGTNGLFVFRDEIAFGFRVSDLFASEDDFLIDDVSEPGTRRMAELIMRRVVAGCFPPPLPTTGPEHGRNLIIREESPEEQWIPRAGSEHSPLITCPRPRPDPSPPTLPQPSSSSRHAASRTRGNATGVVRPMNSALPRWLRRPTTLLWRRDAARLNEP
ncbi:hypothetical protein [Streptomyces sp. NPDC059468]|uniref:hypothetical protein n=1 Tax=Streptomyces sp. NPDC059468 TaxID=3346845 RepID=UPI0036A87A51